MEMSFNEIMDLLSHERPSMTAKPGARCCKYCNTFLAVQYEEPTIVHERNTLTQAVTTKCYYHGKAKCSMCHRYQT